MDYLKLLERSYQVALSDGCPPTSRLDFLGNAVFDFTTYDSAPNELFAGKALEVCQAVSNKDTFGYIKSPVNYQWYLLMVNMPFFANRLEWGTSIRGAWWDFHSNGQTLESCHLHDDEGNQILTLKFNELEWNEFVNAMIKFAADTPSIQPQDSAIRQGGEA